MHIYCIIMQCWQWIGNHVMPARGRMLIVLQTTGFHIIMEHCIRKDLNSYGKGKDFY